MKRLYIFFCLLLFTFCLSQELVSITLPSGKIIKGLPGGFEQNIVKYLTSTDFKNSDNSDIKSNWFVCDRVDFDFGSMKISKSSIHQLDNISKILNEFSGYEYEIAVFTDVMGDANVNKKFSQERANILATTLHLNQIKKATGYGSEYAVYDKYATDEERWTDRKIAIAILQK